MLLIKDLLNASYGTGAQKMVAARNWLAVGQTFPPFWASREVRTEFSLENVPEELVHFPCLTYSTGFAPATATWFVGRR